MTSGVKGRLEPGRRILESCMQLETGVAPAGTSDLLVAQMQVIASLLLRAIRSRHERLCLLDQNR